MHFSICCRDLGLHIITHICKTQIVHIHNPPCECVCVLEGGGGGGGEGMKIDARVTKLYREIAFCLEASSCEITWLLWDSVAAVAEEWLESECGRE